jgi:hypothetical protein
MALAFSVLSGIRKGVEKERPPFRARDILLIFLTGKDLGLPDAGPLRKMEDVAEILVVWRLGHLSGG